MTPIHVHKKILGITALLLGGVSIASAQVMQSSNYQIQSDSINTAGIRSSSTSYTLEDTVGEIATGPSDSTNFRLRAGYQQMQETYLALTGAADVTLTPALPGITGGTANGSTTIIAITDNVAGYELSIVSSSSPAMQHTTTADTIADYTLTTSDPDFTFSVSAGEAEFGFSPEGADIDDRYKDDGGSCNTDTGDTTDRCWDPLNTTATTFARRTSSNHPNGTDTTLKFRAGIGANANVAEGTYVATTTVTLIAL